MRQDAIYKLAKANLSKQAGETGVLARVMKRLVTKPSGQRIVRPWAKELLAPAQKEIRATKQIADLTKQVNQVTELLAKNKSKGLRNAAIVGGVAGASGVVGGVSLTSKKQQTPQFVNE